LIDARKIAYGGYEPIQSAASEERRKQACAGIGDGLLIWSADRAGCLREHVGTLLFERFRQLLRAGRLGGETGEACKNRGNGGADHLLRDIRVDAERPCDLRDHIGRQELHDG
jgi:hypothetical protein